MKKTVKKEKKMKDLFNNINLKRVISPVSEALTLPGKPYYSTLPPRPASGSYQAISPSCRLPLIAALLKAAVNRPKNTAPTNC